MFWLLQEVTGARKFITRCMAPLITVQVYMYVAINHPLRFMSDEVGSVSCQWPQLQGILQ